MQFADYRLQSWQLLIVKHVLTSIKENVLKSDPDITAEPCNKGVHDTLAQITPIEQKKILVWIGIILLLKTYRSAYSWLRVGSRHLYVRNH